MCKKLNKGILCTFKYEKMEWNGTLRENIEILKQFQKDAHERKTLLENEKY